MASPFAATAARILATSEGKSDARRKMIQAARAACRRIGIGDDDRRALQERLTGKLSMSDMTIGELGELLDHLNRDWNGPTSDRAHIGKIRALWWSLYWLGEIDRVNDKALDAFVWRQASVNSIRFVDSRQAFKIIEALKSMAQRAGVDWVARPDALDDRRAVFAAIWAKLVQLAPIGNVSAGAFVGGHLGIPADRNAWSRHEWDAAIKLIGKRLRKELPSR